MTAQSGAVACPFVAFDDARDDRADRPDPRHRCYAENPPAPRARAHQEAYCLSSNFPVCPTFQDWAKRESARIATSGTSVSAAERLRDVPAQRPAGERPASYDRPSPAAASDAVGAVAPTAGAAAADAMVSDQATADPASSAWSRPPIAGGPDDGAGITAGSSAAPVRDVEPDGASEPWDLPPRRPVPPDWSAPPPWVAGGPAEGGSTAPLAPNGPGTGAWSRPAGDSAVPTGVTRPPLPDDVEPPEFLRATEPGAPAAVDSSNGGFEDESDLPELDDEVAARMRSTGGVGAAAAGSATYGGGASNSGGAIDPRLLEDPYDPSAAAKPVAGTTRNVAQPSVGAAAGGAFVAGAAADFDDDDQPPQPAAPPPSSGGLARALGWDRRPRAGSGRPTPAAQPSWEKPRRYEAYPTLKTRVGFGAPSRLLLYAAALLVAAVVLFFVPPLLLRSGGEAGASASPDPSALPGGASARPSGGRTPAPTARQVTYTIKQGDTLSTIARRFHVTVDDILAANKQIKNPNKIAVGDVIVIPTPAPTTITNGEPSPT